MSSAALSSMSTGIAHITLKKRFYTTRIHPTRMNHTKTAQNRQTLVVGRCHPTLES
ncbi:hypothetical protein BDN70DRAFT_885243 [Pholiota conissans]|uniref:Uncharacterized protein n=1 Tax=Pholiota conissans TaxID=109636 RepID=A0A9P5YS30_9AGAR|nr:hypothetical protein BDN70DRAFT_885243 [Pholiota conissans]